MKNYGSKAILSGAAILSSKSGKENSFAMYAKDDGVILGQSGKYNIKGNIFTGDHGKIDILARDASSIEGWITTTVAGKTHLSLSENSVWKMQSSSNLNDLVNENSLIDMTEDAGKFSLLTVKNLSGGNGTIKMDIDASKNVDNSDKIQVSDTFDGTQYVELNEINGYLPIGDEGVGTVLARVKNNSGTFLAKNGEGTLYWKRYELDLKDTEDTSGTYEKDWYLKKVENIIDEHTTSTNSILSANAINYHTWRTENDKLLQRVGELRHNGKAESGAWFKVRRTKSGRNGDFNFKNKYTAYDLGYDVLRKNNTDKVSYQGIAISYVDGKSNYKHGSGENKSKAISFYSTDLRNKGHYLDLVFKVGRLDNEFNVYDTRGNKITGDFKNTGVSFSAEYGRKNTLKNDWYVEPQAQLTLGYLDGDSYNTSNNINVRQSNIKSAVGRVGLNVGKDVGSQGIIYAKANLLHEFAGDYDIEMSDSKDRALVNKSFKDTWLEYGVGAALSTSKNSHSYLDIERSVGSDFRKDWQWNIGARWAF